AARAHYRKRGEENQKQNGEGQRLGEFFGRVESRVPAPKIKFGGGEGERRQPVPLAEAFEGEHGGGENRRVGEEDDFVVGTSGDERGREESADEREEGQALRVASQGDDGDGRGDDDHGDERLRRSEEMVVVPAAPERKIEHSGAESGDAF